MSLHIRPATSDDADTLHGLIVQLAIYEREPDAVEATPALLRAQLASERPPFEAVLAEWFGAPVGMAIFFPNYSTWMGKPGLYLEDLFVPESHRGRGIGKALFCHLASLAVERGYGRMEWAVLDWNTPAIEFYDALGASPMAEWTTFRLTGVTLEAAATGE